jgi:hypothetical protein
MIYAIGIDSDQTFRYFVTQAALRGVEIMPINLREVISGGWRFAIPDDGSTWVRQTDPQEVLLDPQAAYYCRIIDISSAYVQIADAVRWRSLTVAVSSWLEHIPGNVVNRPGVIPGDNSSKPLHEFHLSRLGFEVPQSITSSDPVELRRFASEGKTIVKTVSGVRANARLVDPAEFEKFDPCQGPVHLQRYVRGVDVRAHVIGSAVHAEQIRSQQVDYRAASRHAREFSPYNVSDGLSQKLIEATARLGLGFAGWDLKVEESGRLWCLEANPMPGYDGYDRRLGGAISASLFQLLSSTCAACRPAIRQSESKTGPSNVEAD